MKKVRNFLLFLIVAYTLLCAGLYFAQDKLIFYPDRLPANFRFHEGSEVEIQVGENIFLNCLRLPVRDSKGVILYLHGNRGSNRRCRRQAEMLEGNQYDIFMPDYRGYGKSDGVISTEDQLYQDMQKVYDHLAKRYDESQIVILGYSLGTGMATYLAAKNKPARLVLVAPYLSFVDLKNRRFPFLPDFLLKYPMNNARYLPSVQCPVTLFHGTSDEVIPFDSSVTLQKSDPEKIELVVLEDTGHRRSIFHGLFRSKLHELLR